ncbi:Nucleotidyltransferase [Cupriavidus sp. H19C3]
MNSSEELVYWYLRLNGFFPLTNFVVHRHPAAQHRSDIDVLAVRFPHVFEEVGGQPVDWDPFLTDRLPFEQVVAVICEVKTGAFDQERIFRAEQVKPAVARLGIWSRARVDSIAEQLHTEASVVSPEGVVCKLLVTEETSESKSYLNRTVPDLETFIDERIARYPFEKYGSRMFFSAGLFQSRIAPASRAARAARAPGRPRPAAEAE